MMNHGISSASVVSPPLAAQTQELLKNPRWFYGAGLDLIVGCGAWSIPLLLAAYYFSSVYPLAVPIVFYALALIFNYPHYMATIHRAFRTKEDFAKYKIFTIHLSLIFAVFLVLGHISHQFLAFVFTLYLTWSPFHYTGQNFGIALLFARRSGAETTIATRRMFQLAFFASYAMFFLTFHSFPATDDFVWSLGIPLAVARIFWTAAAVIFLVSIVYSLTEFIKQTGVRAMTAPLVMLSTQIVWFVIPSALTLFTAHDFLQAPATVAILAVMHSAQYLWITSYYARREAQADAQPNGDSMGNKWRYVSYFFVLVVGGIALFVPGPWLASRILNIDFGTSFLVFTALVNLHHFILDGAIWKLRDGRIASLLLNKPRPAGDSGDADFKFSAIVGWILGRNFTSRLLRVSAALALLLLAVIDQIKFYHSAKGNDSTALSFSQQLNPIDASVYVKIARENQNAGKPAAARAALEEAVRINPTYRQAQNSLAKLLIEAGDYENAYRHYQQMFRHLSPDANSLVNFGILAARLNKSDEAVEAWKEAIKTDKNQPNAHFYLAEVLFKKQQFQKAIPHYQQYLILSAEISQEQPELINPLMMLKTAQQLGLAYQKIGDTNAAAVFYTKAVELAETAVIPAGLSFALVRLAEIKAAQGKIPDALANFQRALILEKKGELHGGKPSDWFRYGKFLQKINAPPRLALACFLKASTQLEAVKDADEDAIPNLSEKLKTEIQIIESTLDDAQIQSLKNQTETILSEALSFKSGAL